jgi:hypothetical protein
MPSSIYMKMYALDSSKNMAHQDSTCLFINPDPGQIHAMAASGRYLVTHQAFETQNPGTIMHLSKQRSAQYIEKQRDDIGHDFETPAPIFHRSGVV